MRRLRKHRAESRLVNPQPKYSQQELDTKLLAAANALRGPIDAADFKAYIFPLLFLKRISDTWHWEHARALSDFDGDETLAALPDNYRFVVPEGCRWEEVLALDENVGAGLQLVFDRLQEANPETLAGVFGTVQWANKAVLPEERLTAVLDVFTGMKLDPDSVDHDLLGNGYEYLLKNFADESGKKAGEFFTPRAVVRLMVQLLDPKEEESVYDPACGSGGMLVEAVNQVRAHGQDPRTLRLYGQEVQATTAAIARMNLYLHDIETFSIRRGDTLRDPRFREADGSLTLFDAVIANPPFSLRSWGRSAWADDPFGRAEFGVPPENFADLAFLEHMLASTAPGHGRVAVVMPHGVLFRRGVERDIRRGLIQAGAIEAIIGLAPNLFYNTGIPAAVLVCRPQPSRDHDEVCFVDASRSFEKGRNQNQLRDADVAHIVSAYRNRTAAVDVDTVAVKLVSLSEIEANDWDLSLGRYVSSSAEAGVGIAQALIDYEVAKEVLLEATAVMEDRLRDVGLLD
jgi:type I restriction enzyme M protein